MSTVMHRLAGAMALVLVAAAASSARASATPAALTTIHLLPEAPVQGDTLTLLVSIPDRARVAVMWDRTPVPAFALGRVVRALVGTDPETAAGVHTIRVAVTEEDGTARPLFRAVRLRAARFAVRRLTLPPKTFGLITPANLALEREVLAPVLRRRTAVAWWEGPFQAPSTGPVDSPYGEQGIYNGHREWWHMGVDFQAPAGAPVRAASTGTIALARALPLGGNTVVIDHGQGVLTEYLHLSAFAVREGDRVERGALIGRIGATGLVTGPSLHWGLYVNGIPVNPLFWMSPRPGLTAPK